MPNLKAFLTTIAKKAGLDAGSDDFKAFFEALPDQAVPDALNTGIDNSLLSVADAKNNHPEIKGHYMGQIMSTVDSTIDGILNEAGADDAVKAEIKAERSSFKRMEAMTKRLLELEKGKSKNGHSATQTEIDKLQAELRAEKANYLALKQSHEGELTNMKIREKVRGLVGKGVIPTKYDDLDEDVRMLSLQTVIDKELQEKGAKLTLDTNGNLAIIKNDGSTFYTENHQAITPKAFVESTLTRNKILATSTQQAIGKTTNLPASTTDAGKTNTQPSVGNYNSQRAEAMLKDMQRSGMAI